MKSNISAETQEQMPALITRQERKVFCEYSRCFKWFQSLKLGLTSTIRALGFGFVFKDDFVAG